MQRFQAIASAILILLSFGQLAAAQTNSGLGETALLQVCCRPLPKWSSSRNWVLKTVNLTIVQHLHHCYIDFPAGAGTPRKTAGIHPVEPQNDDKQPIFDQNTDNFDAGGACKVVKDATPEKVQRLQAEISAGTCYSCGKNYHNRPLTGCFNNSNTYVYDMLTGAGMTPPPMSGAPGYRPHHTCRL